jgi:K+-transporting ATPase ATPase C chain
MRPPAWLGQHLTALRTLLLLTVLTGLLYPLAVTAVAQVPGLRHRADASLLHLDGRTVGSSLVGQLYVDRDGAPLRQYFQSRPSAAGDGYDPTATSASNLGPESVVDVLGDPAKAHDPDGDDSRPALLSQVCTRSLQVGQLEGVSGARPYCTSGGLGAVLAVFRAGGTTGPVARVVSLNQECPQVPFLRTYDGVRVTCATYGADYSRGIVTPVRGSAPAHPAVPADAVTASGSGLDYEISPAYAALQVARVARERGLPVAEVMALVHRYTTERGLGFMGEPGVNVLELNVALDRSSPFHG